MSPVLKNREARENQEKSRTSTKDVCSILETEIGPFEIPSNSAFWLKTWVVGGSVLICSTNTNLSHAQFLKGFGSIHSCPYLEGRHLEVDIFNEVHGFNSVVLSEDV